MLDQGFQFEDDDEQEQPSAGRAGAQEQGRDAGDLFLVPGCWSGLPIDLLLVRGTHNAWLLALPTETSDHQIIQSHVAA